MKCRHLAHAYLLFTLCALNNSEKIQDAKDSSLTLTKDLNQSKRDLSLSYAATDIDSKEGTRVKTITVIKNLGKNDKLVINPALHENEEWGSAFRDNFSSYGNIPDVPDVDDLFEFVKKRDEKKRDETKSTTTTTTTTTKQPTEVEKPVKEETNESDAIVPVESTDAVDKIEGDAELIGSNANSTNNNSNSDSTSSSSSLRSQSLRRHRARDSLINFNYTSLNSGQRHSEKYVQENINGYDYPQPQSQFQSQPQLPQKPCGSKTIQITTPSGRTYDITLDNNKNNNGGAGNPYIAPGVSKKPFIQQQQVTQSPSQSTYSSVNSILPPLQTPSAQAFSTPNFNNNNNIINNINTQRPGQALPKNAYSTSQRPYVAPNVIGGIITPKPSLLGKPTFNNAPKYFRTNIFGAGTNRPNTARSRGLKY